MELLRHRLPWQHHRGHDQRCLPKQNHAVRARRRQSRLSTRRHTLRTAQRQPLTAGVSAGLSLECTSRRLALPSPRRLMSDSAAQPEFWNTRYAAGHMPWDFGGVPAALVRFLAAHPGAGRHALIPGCGSGYEIAAFAVAGWDVTAIDFSPPAIAQARTR